MPCSTIVLQETVKYSVANGDFIQFGSFAKNNHMAYAVGVIVAATASTSEADREYRHHAYIIAQLQQQFQITTHHTAILRRVSLIYSQFIANKPTPFTQKKTTHTIPNIVCTRKKNMRSSFCTIIPNPQIRAIHTFETRKKNKRENK